MQVFPLAESFASPFTRLSPSRRLAAKCVLVLKIGQESLVSRGGKCAIFFFARSDWTLETSPGCGLIGTAEKGCIALQLTTFDDSLIRWHKCRCCASAYARRCGDLDLCLLLKAQASLGLTYWVSAVKTAFLWSVTHTLRRKASLALSLLFSIPGVAVA